MSHSIILCQIEILAMRLSHGRTPSAFYVKPLALDGMAIKQMDLLMERDYEDSEGQCSEPNI